MSVEVEPFTDAHKFLSRLRKSNPEWTPRDSWNCRWVFRGQRCACWDLQPSAFRPGVEETTSFKFSEYVNGGGGVFDDLDTMFRCPDGMEPKVHRERMIRIINQQFFEFRGAHTFKENANHLGVRVPDRVANLPNVRTVMQGFEPHSVHALAQHHGVETRLLDWSENPLFSAFFAADVPLDDTKRCKCGNDEIAVWALNLDSLKLANGWKTLYVPRHENPFLHAQSGLFTYYEFNEDHYLNTGKWRRMEDDVPGIKKLTLNRDEYLELLRLLWIEDITLAHLMPTLDNVKKSLHGVWDAIYKRDRELEAMEARDMQANAEAELSTPDDPGRPVEESEE